MDGNEQECARRISDYIDSLVVQEREGDAPVSKPGDQEFAELTSLAQSLLSIRFLESQAFRGDLLARLPKQGAQERVGRLWQHADPPPPFRAKWAWLLRSLGWGNDPGRLIARTAATIAPLMVVALFQVWHLAVTQTASPADVLSRADLALSKLVHDGQILNRKWRVTETTTDERGVRTMREYVRTEWMDGADFSHVAGLNEENGRVNLAYSSAREGAEVRARVYFAPGHYDESRGLLSIEPTRSEYQKALRSFSNSDRRKLQTYLNRGYIFEPISGERRFNRSMLENDGGMAVALPRVIVSLGTETLASGINVYAVRMIDPARVRFRWTNEGPPRAWVERRETIRYIARDTYLNVRAEETHEAPSGQRTTILRELIETRIVEREAAGVDPFAINVPATTPVRRQSALEHLSAVAEVLSRINPELSR